MNKVFDYNGTFVSASKPVKQLRTVKKTLVVDSADRDSVKYYTNGDFVVYLPRVYENIVSIRLMAAEFPLLASQGQAGALIHAYIDGQNIGGPTDTATTELAIWQNDLGVTTTFPNTYYFLIDIEGLNKSDECAVDASKSTFNDGFFAKIPATSTNGGNFIEYNDHSAQDNIARYTPPIGKLDRLHIRTRLHSQQGNQGFIYWTTDGAFPTNPANNPTPLNNEKGAEFSLSFEIEYLDNVFDDFSSIETRISERRS
jgi:hypothetical protein